MTNLLFLQYFYCLLAKGIENSRMYLCLSKFNPTNVRHYPTFVRTVPLCVNAFPRNPSNFL